MVKEKLCPVCGYEMEEGPRDYNICPSCGTEFGLHDLNSTIESLRQVWLENGPQWYSKVIPKPDNWKPLLQLATLTMAHAPMFVYSNPYSLGVTISATGTIGSPFSYEQRELPCG